MVEQWPDAMIGLPMGKVTGCGRWMLSFPRRKARSMVGRPVQRRVFSHMARATLKGSAVQLLLLNEIAHNPISAHRRESRGGTPPLRLKLSLSFILCLLSLNFAHFLAVGFLFLPKKSNFAHLQAEPGFLVLNCS